MTLRRLRSAAFVATALSSAACERANQKDVASLRSEIRVLGVKVEGLQESLRSLRSDVLKLELAPDYQTASFDPAADEGFSPVRTSIGVFAVSVDDVQPYADGTRVRLSIGNLTAATINGAKVKTKWGEREPKDSTRYLAWFNGLQAKEVPIMGQLRPGSWNSVTLTLPGIPPGKLGYLEVSMETPQISLASPRGAAK